MSESFFNNGKGIKVALTFIPLLPPPKTGEKRRKNAKATPQNRNFYIHEDQTLADLLNIAIDKINKTDILCFEIGNRSGALCPENFDVHYSINRTNSKDIPIENEGVYKELIDEIKDLNRAAASFKLAITECKVCLEGY